MSKAVRILLPSSVLPLLRSAGEAVLARHLEDYSNVLVLTGEERACKFPTICIRRPNPWWTTAPLGRRIARAANHIGHDFNLHLRRAMQAARDFEPDIVLTVAHGSMMFVAQTIATRLRLPLVAFFHDWWPDFQPSRYRRLAENRFRQFHRNTRLALCVSEKMKQQLGERAADIVLPPLPGQVAGTIPSPIEGRPIELHYYGNLSGAYRLPILELLRAARQDSRFRITLTGELGPCSDNDRELLETVGNYQGFLPPTALEQLRGRADVLLVTMSFYEGDRRRVETSFPSKILEYCMLDRPIVVWGPDYCSGVRWAHSTTAAIAVTEFSATVLLARIASTMAQRDVVDALRRGARCEAASRFSPLSIRQRFDQELLKLCERSHATDEASEPSVVRD